MIKNLSRRHSKNIPTFRWNTSGRIGAAMCRICNGFGMKVIAYDVYENRSDEILEHSTTARLLSFPNVMITSHQGFFTKEAPEAIAEITLQNALDFTNGRLNPNQVQ